MSTIRCTMAQAVVRLGGDADLRRRMSLAARSSVVDRFERAPMVDRYEAFYRRVLGRG